MCPTLPSFQAMSASGPSPPFAPPGASGRSRGRPPRPAPLGRRAGCSCGENRETMGKSNWKASGRSGFRSAIVGFKSFGIIISAWHRIKNCGKRAESGKLQAATNGGREMWGEKQLRMFKHPQDQSVWFSLAPSPKKRRHTHTHIRKP